MAIVAMFWTTINKNPKLVLQFCNHNLGIKLELNPEEEKGQWPLSLFSLETQFLVHLQQEEEVTFSYSTFFPFWYIIWFSF